jgi:hypothetical protein
MMRPLLLFVGVISLAVRVQILPVLGAADYVVRSHNLTVELSSRGQIVAELHPLQILSLRLSNFNKI